MTCRVERALFAGLLVALVAATEAPSQERRAIPADTLPERLPAEAPFGLPERRPLGSEEVVRLGRALFFDPLLSRDRSIACASCHQPALGFTDGTVLSTGIDGQRTRHNTPTLFNRAYGERFMWDGRAATLEEQVLMPVRDPREMDLPLEQALARLNADTGYSRLFRSAFGKKADAESLGFALASFIRRLTLGDSPVDRFRAGERSALSAEARSGLWFYESRGGCWRCHGGPNFTDEGFHNTGVGAVDGKPAEGRQAVTGDAADRGRFKTPTLRGVARTAPYMHDGSLETLEEVVEFYRQGGRANEDLDPAMKPIEMTDSDARNLIAFLRALSE